MKTLISVFAILLMVVVFAGCESLSSDETSSWGSSPSASSGHYH